MDDRRREPRSAATIAAKVVFGASPVRSVDATILDRSTRGARISMNTRVEIIPDDIVLLEKISRAWVRARIVWRRDPHYGLFFEAEMAEDPRFVPESVYLEC